MVTATNRRSQRANREAAFERMPERLEEMQREIAPRIPHRAQRRQQGAPPRGQAPCQRHQALAFGAD